MELARFRLWRTPTLFQVTAANQRGALQAALAFCVDVARGLVTVWIVSVCMQFARVHRQPCHQRHAGTAELHAPAAVTGRRPQSRIISRCAPIVRRGSSAALAAPPPLPRLERLKQANRLGSRSAAVNWAWLLAGASRPPRRFKCGLFFAELGDDGLDAR